ncbi:MAG: ATP-binding cassette domain-containing protein, partial [Cellulosilyticaceae bacterium]
FNIIRGSLVPESGDILINGKNVNGLKENERAAFLSQVHQNPSAGVSPALTILENIALSNKKCERFSLKRLIKKNQIEGFKENLKTLELGLEEKLETKVSLLSGGQRQSLSLLMATMKKPDLLLLDEHTAALDPKTSKVVLEKTLDLVKQHQITTLMISHNLRDAIKYSDRIIMLSKGEVVLDVASKAITEEELTQIYVSKQFLGHSIAI